MDSDQTLGCLAAHRVGDAGTHVAALGHVAGVAETTHELGPGARGAAEVPADLERLAGEPISRQRGEHEMERILGAAPVRRRIRQRPDGVDHLDHGAGPAVGHDQWQRVLVRRLDVDEMDVHAIDLAHELRQRVQARRDPPEVVFVLPVARELLQRSQLDALRPVGGQLLARPACCARCACADRRASPRECRGGRGGRRSMPAWRRSRCLLCSMGAVPAVTMSAAFGRHPVVCEWRPRPAWALPGKPDDRYLSWSP